MEITKKELLLIGVGVGVACIGLGAGIAIGYNMNSLGKHSMDITNLKIQKRELSSEISSLRANIGELKYTKTCEEAVRNLTDRKNVLITEIADAERSLSVIQDNYNSINEMYKHTSNLMDPKYESTLMSTINTLQSENKQLKDAINSKNDQMITFLNNINATVKEE